MNKKPVFSTLAAATLSLVSFFLVSSTAFALDVTLTEDQKGAISQHCATTKQSLRTLQRTDARARSYLGSAYENLLTNFITPLDLRLINSGQPNTNLTSLHSKIINTRQQFISEYTAYSQSLEELISADCQSNPEDFYTKLVETRHKRAELSTIVTNLRNLFSEHLTDVKRLRNSLVDTDPAGGSAQSSNTQGSSAQENSAQSGSSTQGNNAQGGGNAER